MTEDTDDLIEKPDDFEFDTSFLSGWPKHLAEMNEIALLKDAASNGDEGAQLQLVLRRLNNLNKDATTNNSTRNKTS